jgi:hypothetical protein
MSTMIDFIGASIVFGILLLTVGRVQVNLNNAQYQASYSSATQQYAVTLARQLEYDFAKIGYHAGATKLFFAYTNRIGYRTDIKNDNNLVVVVYFADSTIKNTDTANPNDFDIYRREGASLMRQQFGLTQFRMAYFDSLNQSITTPITTVPELARIRSIQITFRVESKEPVIDGTDSIYSAVNWTKLIYPRNLSN